MVTAVIVGLPLWLGRIPQHNKLFCLLFPMILDIENQKIWHLRQFYFSKKLMLKKTVKYWLVI
jgi:hypothetical protein